MRVLIVGARGMLGSMLTQVFGDQEVTAWDRDEIDVVNADQVRDHVRALNPEVIINASAYTNVDEAESNREPAFAVNEQGVRNLAGVAKEIDAVIVHYSTDYVFDGEKEAGYAEDDPPGPAVNVYGESKLAGERALVELRPRFYLQRTAWLYGPNGKNFVNTMLNLAKDHRQLSVVADQFGSPTFTKDLAMATRTLLDERYPFGIYHSVNQGVASWFDFAGAIFRIAHAQVDVKAVPTEAFPRPAKRPKYSVLHNTRGPAMRPWQKALEDYLLPFDQAQGKLSLSKLD